MARPPNVATPATAARLVVPLMCAFASPVPAAIATVTLPVKLLARLPRLSRAVTTVPKPVPAATLVGGCVVKTSWLAVPALMSKALLVPLVAPAALAVRV